MGKYLRYMVFKFKCFFSDIFSVVNCLVNFLHSNNLQSFCMQMGSVKLSKSLFWARTILLLGFVSLNLSAVSYGASKNLASMRDNVNTLLNYSGMLPNYTDITGLLVDSTIKSALGDNSGITSNDLKSRKGVLKIVLMLQSSASIKEYVRAYAQTDSKKIEANKWLSWADAQKDLSERIRKVMSNFSELYEQLPPDEKLGEVMSSSWGDQMVSALLTDYKNALPPTSSMQSINVTPNSKPILQNITDVTSRVYQEISNNASSLASDFVDGVIKKIKNGEQLSELVISRGLMLEFGPRLNKIVRTSLSADFDPQLTAPKTQEVLVHLDTYSFYSFFGAINERLGLAKDSAGAISPDAILESTSGGAAYQNLLAAFIAHVENNTKLVFCSGDSGSTMCW